MSRCFFIFFSKWPKRNGKSLKNRSNFRTCEYLSFAKVPLWKWDFHQMDDPNIHIDPKRMQNRCSRNRGPNDANSFKNNTTMFQKWNQSPSRIEVETWTSKNRPLVVQEPIHGQRPEHEWWIWATDVAPGRGKGEGKSLPEGLRAEDTPKPPQLRGLVGFVSIAYFNVWKRFKKSLPPRPPRPPEPNC